MCDGIELDMPFNEGDGVHMVQLCGRVTPVMEEYFDGHVVIGVMPGNTTRSLLYMKNTEGSPETDVALEDAVLAAAEAVREVRRRRAAGL